MNPLAFTIDAGPITTWKVRIFVWKNHAALMRARRRKGSSNGCAAFCWRNSLAKAEKQDDVIAEIHFDLKDLRLRYVVHEAYHALYAYVNTIRLREQPVEGEELAAESIEHMVDGILWMLKKNKVRVI